MAMVSWQNADPTQQAQRGYRRTVTPAPPPQAPAPETSAPVPTPEPGSGGVTLPAQETPRIESPNWGFGFHPVPPPQTSTYTPPPEVAAPQTPAAVQGPLNGHFQDWFMGQLQGKPFNQQTLLDMEGVLNQYGSKLTPANAQGERTKIWDPTSNQWVRVGFGEGRPVWVPQGNGQSEASGSTWNDPATQQIQDYLQKFLGQLAGQSAQWGPDAAALRQQQTAAQAATDRLIAALQGRAQTLQGPVYAGPQQEVLRTQALDPIEHDRAAAQKRALERISMQGYLPSSGIAADLQNQVDQPFDRARAQAQNLIAAQTIQQGNANQDEALQLLGLVPQAQRAGMTGDLSFLQALNTAVNQPMQTGLPLSSLIYDLPNQAMQQALATLGMGGSNPSNVFQSAVQLAQQQGLAQTQGVQWYQQLGALLPYLLGGH